MSKEIVRPLNKRSVNYPHADSGFCKCLSVYMTEERKETYDITKAMLDYDGAPIVVRSEASSEPLDVCVSHPATISFSPSNPVERIQAFEQLSAFSKRASMPCVLIDKFEASKIANNVCDNLSKQFDALQQVDTQVETPSAPKVEPKVETADN